MDGENKYSIQKVQELVSWVVGMVAHEIFVSTLGVFGILSERVKMGHHPYHALHSLSHHAADKYKNYSWISHSMRQTWWSRYLCYSLFTLTYKTPDRWCSARSWYVWCMYCEYWIDVKGVDYTSPTQWVTQYCSPTLTWSQWNVVQISWCLVPFLLRL